ncbi:hypothetical protein P8C59_001470 [Phyllachora maydis]|uniref:Peptidase S26 domain-containing protein n=1 Tax=Phyllachora maydis TaxID=1825666 RepID=A0AAD9HZM0_9PEZI|nr:hypothetical protein P8C59_001470 [Phyllachora maydis]
MAFSLIRARNSVEFTRVDGPSMRPFLNDRYNDTAKKDLCLTLKWRAQDTLQRGMIVVFRKPHKPEEYGIKRVIAMEGDVVYTKPPYADRTVRIPPEHIWVEGDGDRTLDRRVRWWEWEKQNGLTRLEDGGK